jgi:hypothetical protein
MDNKILKPINNCLKGAEYTLEEIFNKYNDDGRYFLIKFTDLKKMVIKFKKTGRDREAFNLKLLENNSIPVSKLIDYGAADDSYYIITEFADGTDILKSDKSNISNYDELTCEAGKIFGKAFNIKNNEEIKIIHDAIKNKANINMDMKNLYNKFYGDDFYLY